MVVQTALGVVDFFARESSLRASSAPLRSASINERERAVISTAATQPRSARKRIMSGGRPPFDAPSPRGAIRPADSSQATTFVTVGALNPEARTRYAREHAPASRSKWRMLRAL